jgi:hypothetical protein
MTVGGGQPPKVERIPVEFPTAKADIENQIVSGFMRDVGSQPSAKNWYGEASQNPERGLDFDVKRGDGSIWELELTELVPVPFHELDDKAPLHTYMALDFVDFVLDRVAKKAVHYGHNTTARRILLLYVTDSRFAVMRDIADVVMQGLLSASHSFDYIYFYRPVSKDEGDVIDLYPPPSGWTPSASRESLAQRQVWVMNNANPTFVAKSYKPGPKPSNPS